MAVTSLRTSLEDFEAPGATYTNYGGGSGASTNTDVFLEGIQSGGRRADNVTDFGFGVTFASTDLSAANQHIKIWLWVTQWGSTTQIQARLSDGTNNDDHELPTSEYPSLGGFIPLWVDVSRTPEIGGSANEASISEVGILIDIGNVGGNAQNLILDEITYGTSGLRWDGTGGSFADFESFESTNSEGVLITNSGVLFCYARMEIGSSTATTFSDSSFQLVFPDQGLVSSTFMGLTFDLQNASTTIDLSNGVITSSNVSGATNRFDITATSNSGTLDFTSMTITGARIISLTSSCTIDGGLYQTLELTQSSAEIKNCTIQTNSSSGVAVIDDVTFGSTSGIHDVTFEQVGLGHALEITAVGTYTLTNLNFVGYGTTGNNDAAIYVSATSGTVTLNIQGGNTPTYRTAGATVVVQNTVTVSVTVRDANTTSVIQNARVFLLADSGGDLPYQDSVSITRSGSTATVTHTAHNLTTGDEVFINGSNQDEYNGIKSITVTGANTYTFTVTGTPVTPATGSITSTSVVLNGLTDVNGVYENTGFNFTNNQPVIGRVRKGSSSPRYKTSPLSGTIINTGFSSTTFLVGDE